MAAMAGRAVGVAFARRGDLAPFNQSAPFGFKIAALLFELRALFCRARFGLCLLLRAHGLQFSPLSLHFFLLLLQRYLGLLSSFLDHAYLVTNHSTADQTEPSADPGANRRSGDDRSD